MLDLHRAGQSHMENVIYLSQLSHLCGAQFRFTEAILALKRIFQHQNRMFLPFMPFSLVDAQKSAFFLVHMRLPWPQPT